MRPLPDPTVDASLHNPTGYVRVVEATFTRGETPPLVVSPISGSLTQDRRTTQRWSGSLTLHVDGDDIPQQPGDLLTPFGSICTVTAGIVDAYGQQSVVPFGRFVVSGSAASIGPSGRVVTVQLTDLASRVALNRFQQPLTVGSGVDLAQVAAQVVTDRDPTLQDAVDNILDTGTTLGRRYTFGVDEKAAATDPWAELIEVLQSGGFTAHFTRDGTLMVESDEMMFDNVRDVNPNEATINFTDRPPNVVVARGVNPGIDTSAPWGIAEDDDPSSPTFVGGPYGRVTFFYASPLLTTAAQARQAARTRLSNLTGVGATWTVTRPYDPTIDVMDGLQLVGDNTSPSPVDGTMLMVDAVTVNVDGPTMLICHQHPELEDN